MPWSPHATTTERMLPGAHVPQLERENLHTTTREKPEHRSKETMRCNKRSHMPEQRSRVLQLRPDAVKNIRKINKLKKKKEQSRRHNPPRLQTILQSYGNQDSMVLAQKSTYGSMEQNRAPK